MTCSWASGPCLQDSDSLGRTGNQGPQRSPSGSCVPAAGRSLGAVEVAMPVGLFRPRACGSVEQAAASAVWPRWELPCPGWLVKQGAWDCLKQKKTMIGEGCLCPKHCWRWP